MTDTFHKSVKPFEVEELIDYFFFRRLAATFVPFFAKIGFSPNQVTTLGLFVGIGTAFLFLYQHFFLGGLGLLLTVVLDCVDGQLARFTGKTSEEGRILDGIFDHIWVTFIWVFIFMSDFLDFNGVATVAWVESLAGVSIIAHCGWLIKIKTEFLQIVSPEYTEKEITQAEALDRLKKARENKNYFHIFIYAPLLFHMKLFGEHKNLTLPELSNEQREKGKQLLSLPMRLISFTGEGSHHILMIVFALLTPWWPNAMFFNFLFILIPMNILWGAALLLWIKRKKEIF